jgi:cell division septum initiation protein DivIVA
MVDDESSEASQKSEPSPGPSEQRLSLKLRGRAPADIRPGSFPVSVRGYDSRAVDAYGARVNSVIAELEVSRSPQAAVRHALDRLSEQTSGILQEARESAEQITASARADAEETTAHAKAEAAEIVVNASELADATKAEAAEILAHAKAEAEKTLAASLAEAEERRKQVDEEIAAARQEAMDWVRQLHSDTEAVSEERREMLDDIHGMAERLEELAGAAARRLQPRDLPRETEEAMRESEAGAETKPTEIAAPDDRTEAMPVVVSREGADESPDETPK